MYSEEKNTEKRRARKENLYRSSTKAGTIIKEKPKTVVYVVHHLPHGVKIPIFAPLKLKIQEPKKQEPAFKRKTWNLYFDF